ncbi:MAG: hypothetical protein FJW31_24740 [Acidobacteria bacterium]|nr:hypothetical protein [Acidobacteriota bacterium]
MPGDLNARSAREGLAVALQAQHKTDEAIALLRAIYADHHDSAAARQLTVELMPRATDREEAETIAREWFARSEPGILRAEWTSLLAELLYQRGQLEESRLLREQSRMFGSCGGVAPIQISLPEDAPLGQIVESLSGPERIAFDALFRAVQLIGSLEPALAQRMAQEMADDLAAAFSRTYTSVHPLWAIDVAVLHADQLAALGLAQSAAEIARRAEALLIEHQVEDSPLFEDARVRLSRFRPNAAAAPSAAW